jgi:hypothetical protein
MTVFFEGKRQSATETTQADYCKFVSLLSHFCSLYHLIVAATLYLESILTWIGRIANCFPTAPARVAEICTRKGAKAQRKAVFLCVFAALREPIPWRRP